MNQIFRLVAFFSLLVYPWETFAHGQEQEGHQHMMDMMFGGGGFGMMGTGWVLMFIFWIIVVVGIVALIVWLVNKSDGVNTKKQAIKILEERYAKGEINEKEFLKKKKILIK